MKIWMLYRVGRADDRSSCALLIDELPRLNFDLAHELGHMVLHNGVDVNSDNLARVERQANYFAGCFLLPRETFSREVFSTSIHYFFKLKERWRVSVAAMIYRCKELGILNANQISYLFRQLTAKGMRKREPLDTAFKTEIPPFSGPRWRCWSSTESKQNRIFEKF